MMKQYLGVIIYQGEKTPFLELDTQPLLDSMNHTIRKCKAINKVVMVSYENIENGKAIADLCKQVGVPFYILSKRQLLKLIPLALSMLRLNGVVLINSYSPFVQDFTIRAGIAHLEKTKADIVSYEKFPEGLSPYNVMSWKYLFKKTIAQGMRLLTLGKLTSIAQGKGAKVEVVRWNDFYTQQLSLSMRIDEQSDIKRFQRFDLLQQINNITDFAAFAKTAEESYMKALHADMQNHPEPHLLNEKLNEAEMRMGKTELQSYPISVGLNFTPACNVHCTFCTYDAKKLESKEMVNLEAIQQMTWLKYVKNFFIWGGIGDSLVHPQFLDIFNNVRETYPHLYLHLSTNAVRLTPQVTDTLVGRLNGFNVSLNAASRETYQKLMRVDRWEVVYNNLKYLGEKRKSLDTTKPSLAASIVMTRENVEELEKFVDIVKEWGFDSVTFVHYVTTTTVGERLLAAGSSLYHYKELSDKHLAAAIHKAEEYGLTVTAPPLFSETEGINIVYGTRSKAPVWNNCTDPWKVCYLTVNDVGIPEMIFCCSGLYYHIEYEKSDLSETTFWKLWNHPTAQYFRQTTNETGANPICTFCKTKDRFEPDSQEIYQIYDSLNPKFKKMAMEANEKPVHFVRREQ